MNRLHEILIDKNIQQKEIALAVGVSRPTVSEWVSNKKDPRSENLRKLADFLQIDWHEIIIPDSEVVSPSIFYRVAPQPHIPEETISDIVERVKTDIERNAGGIKLTTAEQQLVTEYRQLSATQKARVSAMIAGYLDAKYDK